MITQRDFVECADVDGIWIDHQIEEHSDQEDTEEQKQMVVVGRNTHAEDAGEGIASVQSENTVTGRAMPLPHQNVVRGMKNLGSTCYFNAVLQSLLALGNMRVIMLEPDALPPKGSLGQELKNLFMETYGNNDAKKSIPLVPENLFNIMCSRNSKFQRGVTEDSNIMLISLLDGLNDEEPGMFESLFYGQVGKNLRCRACGHATYNDGEKLDLSLAIPSKKPVSVEDCLDLYAQGNIQDWRCTDCFSAAGNASTNQTEQSDSGTQISVPDNNEDEHQMEQTQKVEKKICRTVASEPNQITKAPPVLIIQLKRFNYDPHAPHDKTQKLGEPVIFEETLDITKFMHPRYGHIYSVQYDSFLLTFSIN
jgi:ubiquitin carboxyl-terminal hydrolase 16/45